MHKSLPQWLEYLDRLATLKLEPGLERISIVAKRLELTSAKLPGAKVVIGGTNGKGSCVALLEAMALAAGYRVAAFTSPHIICYNERIRINGNNIDDASLCLAFTAVAAAATDIKLNYFEFTTLAALYLFSQLELDLLLLEVGLGGCLDPVNIVDADITVIASISLDHTAVLGTDRESIAAEKAGIMRAAKPVVCGDLKPPMNLIKRAKELQAPLYCLNHEYLYKITPKGWRWQAGDIYYDDLPLTKLPLVNAATALMVLQLLPQKIVINIAAITTGLRRAFLLGRLQWLAKKPEVILDGAHNPASVNYLAAQLKLMAAKRTVAVVAMMHDKDIRASLKELLPLVDGWYLADLQPPRGAKAFELQQALEAIQPIKCYTHASIQLAYQHAVADCRDQDRIVIFGTFRIIAPILRVPLEI